MFFSFPPPSPSSSLCGRATDAVDEDEDAPVKKSKGKGKPREWRSLKLDEESNPAARIHWSPPPLNFLHESVKTDERLHVH